jgi:hypothetical protein
MGRWVSGEADGWWGGGAGRKATDEMGDKVDSAHGSLQKADGAQGEAPVPCPFLCPCSSGHSPSYLEHDPALGAEPELCLPEPFSTFHLAPSIRNSSPCDGVAG